MDCYLAPVVSFNPIIRAPSHENVLNFKSLMSTIPDVPHR